MDRDVLLANLKQAVSRSLDASSGKLHALSRDIWSCPELAYEEIEAHDRLVDFFQQDGGWKVDSPFRLDTAFRACWRSGGSSAAAAGDGEEREKKWVNVGFLCEYDALPGIGHACGHNLIAEVGAAAALGLRAAVEEAIQELPVHVEVLTQCYFDRLTWCSTEHPPPGSARSYKLRLPPHTAGDGAGDSG